MVLYYHNKQYGQPPLETIRENFITYIHPTTPVAGKALA